jgi:hypothetical protein
MDPPGRRLVFLHIPKTGGTTLHHQLARGFAPEQICPDRFATLDRHSPAALAAWRFFSGHFNFDQLRLVPAPRFVVTVLREPAERILSTYVYWRRHTAAAVAERGLAGPAIARQRSLLDFLRSPEPVVRDAIDNTMARALAGAVGIGEDGSWRMREGPRSRAVSELDLMHRATGNLLSVDVVGFAQDLAGAHARVARAFGLPAGGELPRLNTRDDPHPDLVPAAEVEVTREVRRELARLTTLDREIWRLARLHRRLRR